MKKETLCAVASGSGGHILPALIAARTWHQQHPQGTVIFCTGTSSLDKKILGNYQFISSIIHFTITKFIPKKIWLYPLIILQILQSLGKSFWVIFKHRPSVIVSTGGLIAFPLCLAGRLLGSRIEVYELNVVPGKAVKLLMPLAHVMYTPFHATQKYCRTLGINFAYKCKPCTYPIRFTEQDKNIDKATVIQSINTMMTTTLPFTSARKTIFLLGGSQGSLMLNNTLKNFLQNFLFVAESPAIPINQFSSFVIPDLIRDPSSNRNVTRMDPGSVAGMTKEPTPIPNLPRNRERKDILKSIQVIHQTGNLNNFDWVGFYQKLNIPAVTFSYYEHVKDFYGLADLVICRAGAGTIFEVAFFNKPCIVIPLVATSTAHQVDNAREISKQYPHLFTMIEQSTVTTTPTVLYKTIMEKLHIP